MRLMFCTLICLLTAACGDPDATSTPLAQPLPPPIVYPTLPLQSTINIVIKPVHYPERIQ